MTDQRHSQQVSEGRVVEPFYKFLEPKWAHLMLKQGNLRIGTLREYTDDESYAGSTLDKGEGTRQVSIYHKELGKKEAIALGWLSKEAAPHWTFEGNTVTNSFFNQRAPNCHIYCLTGEITLENVRRNDGAENRPACVAILNSSAFLRSLKAHTNTDARLGTCRDYHECKYIGRHHVEPPPMGDQAQRDFTLNPAILKNPSHAWQKEYRIPWDDDIDRGRLEPICYSKIPGISETCFHLVVDDRIHTTALTDSRKLRLTAVLKDGSRYYVDSPAQNDLVRTVLFYRFGMWHLCAVDESKCGFRVCSKNGEEARWPIAQTHKGDFYPLCPFERLHKLEYSLAGLPPVRVAYGPFL